MLIQKCVLSYDDYYQQKYLNNIELLGLDQMVVNFNALEE